VSRDLAHCHPLLLPKVQAWLRAAKDAGLDPLITCTYRPQSEQDKLYAQGRTTPGKVVTWTRHSNHSFALGNTPSSLAIDFVPIVYGKAVWTANHPHWKALGALAAAQGLVWGGNFLKTKDFPHIELANARELNP
jgi:peptidoglycan LD-endopeptidase CwlK